MGRTSLLNVHRLISEAEKVMNPEDVANAFLADLNRCIVLSAKKGRSGKPTPTYKPSSMTCIRNMYYQIVQEDQDPDDESPDFIGIGHSGTDRHERIQNAVQAMKDFGMDCEYIDVEEFVKQRNLTDLEVVEKCGNETKLIHKKYNLRFLCDGIIKYKGKYYILEIKTEASFKWMNRTGVDPSHYDQATAYSLSFGLDGVLFIYENRDVCSKKAYLFIVGPQRRSDLAHRIQTCDTYVERHIAPPKPDDIPKKTCSYCRYKSACRRDR